MTTVYPSIPGQVQHYEKGDILLVESPLRSARTVQKIYATGVWPTGQDCYPGLVLQVDATAAGGVIPVAVATSAHCIANDFVAYASIQRNDQSIVCVGGDPAATGGTPINLAGNVVDNNRLDYASLTSGGKTTAKGILAAMGLRLDYTGI